MQGLAPRGDAGETGWGARLPATLLLSALLLLAFRGALSGRLFYLRDIGHNHYPIRQMVTEVLRSGALPLWNPYHGGGTPLLANPDNLVLHPISTLFLFLPFDAAFTASILLQYALLAWGGYLLARALRVGRPGSALAAAILALSGPAASVASMQNVLSAAAWVPLALWAWLRGLERGARWFLPIAAGCAAVILITAEAASVIAFVVLAMVLGLTACTPERRRPEARRVLGAFLLVVLLAMMMAAVQLLPGRELLALSSRGAGFTAAEGLKWSLDPRRLAEVVLPRLYGDPTRLSPGAWWGGWIFEGGYPFLLTIYLGAIPCLLAAAAMWQGGPERTRRRALGAAGAGFLLLALGRHSTLYSGLYSSFAMVRQVRYPERFLLPALVVVALLAAMGLDRLLRDDGAARRMLVWFAALAAVVFIAVSVLVAWSGAADRLLAGVARVPAALMRSGVGPGLRGAVLHSFLWMFVETVALVLATAAVVGSRRRTTRQLSGWGVVAISGLSMTLAAAPALSTAAPGWLTDQSPLASVVDHGPASPRLHHEPRPDNLSIWGRTDELAWGYRFDRFAYDLATGHAEGVPTMLDAATDRMDLRAAVNLGHELSGMSLDARIKILSICHVGFLLTYDRVEHSNLEKGPVLEGLSRPPLRSYRLRKILPRARFVTRADRPSYPGDAARSLADPGFDPETTVLLDATGPESPPAGAAPPGRVTSLVERAELLRFRVEAPAAGYLVVADAFAPGWRARVDGVETAVRRADFIFRAVAVPPGSHEVEMSYLPSSVVAGGWMSATGWLGAIAGIVLMRRRNA